MESKLRSPGRAGMFKVCRAPILAAAVLVLSAEARAAEPAAPASPPDTTLSLEVRAGALYDNNAALGRRGLFGAEAITDVTSVIEARGALLHRLGGWGRFLLTSRLRSEEARWREYLRNTEVSLRPGLELDLTPLIVLRPEVDLKLHREVEEVWGYVETTPSLTGVFHTRFGMVFEVGYEFKATLFDSEELTNTYANVDRLTHLGRLGAKLWQTQSLRYSLKAEVEHQWYDDNIDTKLAHIVFAPVERYTDPDLEVTPGNRTDLILRGELEALWIPWKHMAIAGGYRVEHDSSSTDAYQSLSHGPRLAALFEMGRHEAFLEARLTFFDFYRFRYDVRYSNTRKDIKLEGFAAYQVRILDGLKVGLKATFLRNDSNDAGTFPGGEYRFDPGLSRSFSLYQGTRVELYLAYTWDTQAGGRPPEKKDEPLPGTIMAGR